MALNSFECNYLTPLYIKGWMCRSCGQVNSSFEVTAMSIDVQCHLQACLCSSQCRDVASPHLSDERQLMVMSDANRHPTHSLKCHDIDQSSRGWVTARLLMTVRRFAACCQLRPVPWTLLAACLLSPHADRHTGDISFTVSLFFCTIFCNGYLRRGLTQGDET